MKKVDGIFRYESDSEILALVDKFREDHPKGFYSFGPHTLSFIYNFREFCGTMDIGFFEAQITDKNGKLEYFGYKSKFRSNGSYDRSPFEYDHVKKITVVLVWKTRGTSSEFRYLNVYPDMVVPSSQFKFSQGE